MSNYPKTQMKPVELVLLKRSAHAQKRLFKYTAYLEELPANYDKKYKDYLKQEIRKFQGTCDAYAFVLNIISNFRKYGLFTYI